MHGTDLPVLCSFPAPSASKTRQMLQIWSWLVHESADKKCGHRIWSGGDQSSRHGSPQQGNQSKKWTLHVADKVPRQSDGCSCGVFLIGMLDMLTQGLLPPYAFSQVDIPRMRGGVAVQLLQGGIS
jgi:hypothetical protein